MSRPSGRSSALTASWASVTPSPLFSFLKVDLQSIDSEEDWRKPEKGK
jgi:hypothetical protein